MKYLLRYTLAKDARPERLRELFPAHRAHWESYREDGSLLAIGPMENPAEGSLAIFTTREAAEAFAVADPFVTEGLAARWDVAGWREAILGD